MSTNNSFINRYNQAWEYYRQAEDYYYIKKDLKNAYSNYRKAQENGKNVPQEIWDLFPEIYKDNYDTVERLTKIISDLRGDLKMYIKDGFLYPKRYIIKDIYYKEYRKWNYLYYKII